MSENEDRSLQRPDISSQLPSAYERLSEEEQSIVAKRLVDQDIRIREDYLRKSSDNQAAEQLIRTGLEANRELDTERKVYTQSIRAEGGSGNINIEIRGGDTRFIVPVLIAIAIVIFCVALLVAALF